MNGPRAYLDWNATAPLRPEAREAMIAAMATFGNPASIHQEGRQARALIEAARQDVAALAGARAENVFFVSGASEAAAALLGPGLAPAAPRLVASVEHPAILAAAGPDAIRLPVDEAGRIDRARFEAALAAAPKALVAIQLANSETGIVQDIAALAPLIRRHGGTLIVDAVQAPGRMPLDIAALGAAAIILSAHKFGGPKGVGAIVFADARTRLAPALIQGGGQESGQRGGTENVLGIVGMGAAARVLGRADEALHPSIQRRNELQPIDENAAGTPLGRAEAAWQALEKMSHLRNTFESHLKELLPSLHILGESVPRLCNTSAFAVPGLGADQALIALDLDGIAVSSGSACSSGKVRASHVLAAMGAPDWVKAGAIRVSIGPDTAWDALERCLASLARQSHRRQRRESAA